MSHIAPDTLSRLKPDFLAVVHKIYTEMCNLQRGEKTLIISDARTPWDIVATFQGMAMVLGSDAVIMECKIPFGGPTYQPNAEWSPMLAAAAKEADLIVDLAVGYADFIADAMDKGARVIMPGDGIGGPYLDDMLMRTIRDTNIHAVRRAADRVADRFTDATTCTLITGENDRLKIDLTNISGIPADGFLWDADKNDWKSNYAILPPAQPGVVLPKGLANGTVSVDGTVLWHQTYHEQPRVPLKLTFENSRLVDLKGDAYLVGRIRAWLDELGDEDANVGPNHLNIGLNPGALMTQNQEWERIYGSVTCGMGDMRVGSKLMLLDHNVEWPISCVHWDWTVMQPTILLDDKVLLKNSVIQIDT